MDLNSTHSCDFSYHNITRSQVSIDKYNGESKRINIPEKILGQEVIYADSLHKWIRTIPEGIDLRIIYRLYWK